MFIVLLLLLSSHHHHHQKKKIISIIVVVMSIGVGASGDRTTQVHCDVGKRRRTFCWRDWCIFIMATYQGMEIEDSYQSSVGESTSSSRFFESKCGDTKGATERSEPRVVVKKINGENLRQGYRLTSRLGKALSALCVQRSGSAINRKLV